MSADRYGQQMAAGSTATTYYIAGKVCGQSSFAHHQGGAHNCRLTANAVDRHTRGIQQVTQVTGAGAVVRCHQQAKQLVEPITILHQGMAIKPLGVEAVGWIYRPIRRCCRPGIQHQCAEYKTFQGIAGCPAHRGYQRNPALAPHLRRQQRTKAQFEPPASALVAVYRGRQRQTAAVFHDCR